jgi:hypothetical protein
METGMLSQVQTERAHRLARAGSRPAVRWNIVTSKSTDKASSVAKLQELQPLRDEAMAKFDDDIAAWKRVLSFM